MKSIFLLFIGLLVFSCTSKNKPAVNFYHWKSIVNFNDAEIKLFNDLQSEKLYIRLFDIDTKNGESKPIGTIKKFDNSKLITNYIPTVFITNRTFINIDSYGIERLVENTFSLISKITTDNNLGNFNEIQIDCDWTNTTKENYFNFLNRLKNLTKTNISCTLRLHQVKFKEKTGVPPVKKVYLMCYATSNPIQNDGENSILDLNLLKDYLKTINDYPIAFDIALPIYSWGVVTNHLGKSKLINAVTESDLSVSDFKKEANHEFTAINDTFLHKFYVNKGFKIKVETITPELLKQTKKYLASKINQPYNIVYYHLDSIFTNRFSLEDFQ